MIQLGRLREAQAMESRGQAILAKQKWKKIWGKESTSDLQRGQRYFAAKLGKMALSLEFKPRLQVIFPSLFFPRGPYV